MDTNPTVRHSFWSVLIGGTFYWATMYCSNQASIQKYLSVDTLSAAQRWVPISPPSYYINTKVVHISPSKISNQFLSPPPLENWIGFLFLNLKYQIDSHFSTQNTKSAPVSPHKYWFDSHFSTKNIELVPISPMKNTQINPITPLKIRILYKRLFSPFAMVFLDLLMMLKGSSFCCRAVWFGSLGVVVVFGINFLTGLVLFKHYESCDPVLSQVCFYILT